MEVSESDIQLSEENSNQQKNKVPATPTTSSTIMEDAENMVNMISKDGETPRLFQSLNASNDHGSKCSNGKKKEICHMELDNSGVGLENTKMELESQAPLAFNTQSDGENDKREEKTKERPEAKGKEKSKTWKRVAREFGVLDVKGKNNFDIPNLSVVKHKIDCEGENTKKKREY